MKKILQVAFIWAHVLSVLAFPIYAEGATKVFDPCVIEDLGAIMARIASDDPPGYETILAKPTLGERLSANTVVLVDATSKLVLRFQLLEFEGETTKEQLRVHVENMAPAGELEEVDGRYYKTIPERTGFVLRDVLNAEVFKRMEVTVYDYSGVVLISTMQKKKPGVFQSEALDKAFAAFLEHYGAGVLSEQIDFSRPIMNEKLPLSALCVTDFSSTVTFQFTPVSNVGLAEEGIMQRLKTMYSGAEGSRIWRQNGNYYCRMRESIIYVLADSTGDAFLSNFEIRIHDYSGDVYISTDVDKISGFFAKGVMVVRADPECFVPVEGGELSVYDSECKTGRH